jgi:hypothetical protein
MYDLNFEENMSESIRGFKCSKQKILENVAAL